MKARFPGFQFVYIDAEFTPNNHTPGGLVSFAAHTQDASLYLINNEADREDFCSDPFRRHEIWNKHLPLLPGGSLDCRKWHVVNYKTMTEAVGSFFTELTGGEKYRNRIGLIADHGTQDVQRLHDLFDNDWFNRMPPSVPKKIHQDLATLEDLAGVVDDHLPNGLRLPENPPERKHHALHDARWDKEVHEFLMTHSRAVRVASGVELLEN